MKKPNLVWLGILMTLALVISSCAAPAQAPTQAPAAATEAPAAATEAPRSDALILATTTSTDDSGLLDYLLPDFEKEFGVKVDVIAVGTGQALTLGQDGNADVLLVHSRAKEDEFMAAGHGVRREDVMYNDFVILGPESDPAGIKGMTSAADAFMKIAESQSAFISRGDESGTHTKELSIWKKAGIEPAGDWYISTGQGMGEVLTMTNEQQAYTLSDRATYLARSKEGLNLVVLVEGDKTLFNPYGVIAVNPNKNPQIKVDLANKFIDWIISLPVQEKIAQFGMEDFGQSLFIPDAPAWREAHPAAGAETEAPAAPVGEAAFKVTGLVEKEMGWSDAELKAMETITIEYTNKKGETDSYTGVLVNKLLELAGLQAEATKIVLVAGDGFTAEVPLADLQACTECIVAFDDDGTYRAVMPGFDSKQQVKELVEIQVQ